MFVPPQLSLSLNATVENVFRNIVSFLSANVRLIVLLALVLSFGLGMPTLVVAQEETQYQPWQRIVYFVITDRFANGDTANDGIDVDLSEAGAFHGRDFAGLTLLVSHRLWRCDQKWLCRPVVQTSVISCQRSAVSLPWV